MREIKFRSKRADNGEWVYGYLFVNQSGAHYILDTNNDGDNGITCRFTLVDPATVGQFTGLKDKNGVEIYEGDVVIPIAVIGSRKSAIQWHKNGWYMCYDGIPTRKFEWSEDYEVISSVHDTPTLAQGGDER